MSKSLELICDMTGLQTEEEVSEIIYRIPSRIPEISFKKHEPISPIHNIPLITYFWKIPSLIPERTSDISIKTEFLLEDLKIPHVTLPKATTFALETKNIKCYTVPSLIGDKLLTLASNTIGVTKEGDVPKQIYDVATLSELYVLSPDDFAQIQYAMNKLIPVESGYRDLQLEEREVLSDIQTSLQRYCLLGTSGEDGETWNNITRFQQFYVNSSQRKNRDEWAEQAWRLRFLTELIGSMFEGESAQTQAIKYSSAINTSKKLSEVKGARIIESRKELLKHAKQFTPFFKQLRGKSLNRVFWQVIDRENLEDVQSSLPLDTS